MESLPHGLNTQDALDILIDDIESVFHHLDSYFASCQEAKTKESVATGFHINVYVAPFRWVSCLYLLFACVCLLISFFTCARNSCSDSISLLLEAIFIILIVAFNNFLIWWDKKLKYEEIPRLTRRILDLIRSQKSEIVWQNSHYPHLHTPLSPCITLQWARRDGQTVNLPWTLLVRGDIILLKPGQKVPAWCKLMSDREKSCPFELKMGDRFSPHLDDTGDRIGSPKARIPLKVHHYRLLETPFVSNLRLLLSHSLSWPMTVFDRQRYLLFSWTCEYVLITVFFVLVFGVNALRLYYQNWVGHLVDALLLSPVSASLPLMPLMFPVMWLLLNWIGTASILTIFYDSTKLQDVFSDDPFEVSKLEALPLTERSLRWKELRKHLISIALGQTTNPVRVPNLVHILASVTNLCCIDKKGILSWPNPTAEKILFLKGKVNSSHVNSLPHEKTASIEHLTKSSKSAHVPKESDPVCLSLTHNNQSPFGLEFDDRQWQNHLPSLKPLGLSILLNTCNKYTQKHYAQFCAHISCEAMNNDYLVPVSQRRCMCVLAKQMGFTDSASKPFKLEHQLSAFRHVPPDMACKDRITKAFVNTKLKFPFPHMMSVLVRDVHSQKLELFSQGTADIILDCCTDYWDGFDIKSLTDKDRKKILDFYRRSNLSAQCTAFAYRPTSCVVKEDPTKFYMELPIESTYLYNAAMVPSPHISIEALYGDHDHTEYEEIDDIDDCFRIHCKQIFIGMVVMQYQAKTDMVQMIEQLDKACIRFVHFSKENELRSRVFSEKMGLESGWNCHISLLSDSDRTGSGNACHPGQTSSKVSGLSLYQQSSEELNNSEFSQCRFKSSLEVSKPLSHSAPSGINLDRSQVKFEREVSIYADSNFSVSSVVDQYLDRGDEWQGEGSVSEESIFLIEEDVNNLGISSSSSYSDCCSSRSGSPSQSSGQCNSIGFDMSNRARLPRGIENIRPHLRNVDNVPLLVSLFTDCTPPTICEMLSIMQENNEVNIVMGSSLNADNMRLFTKADASISIEPLFPQVCMKEETFFNSPSEKGTLTPIDVTAMLNSILCSLHFHRNDRVSLVHLIMESRHYMRQVMTCFQFWACCCISLSLLQLVGSCLLLPPVLAFGDVLWLVSFVIPLLSASLVPSETDPAVMEQATGKNDIRINKEVVKYVVFYYGFKFFPSLLVIVICAWLTFSSLCLSAVEVPHACSFIYVTNNTDSGDHPPVAWLSGYTASVVVMQAGVAVLVVFYFCTISVCYVHRLHSIWKKLPFCNAWWVIACLLIIVLQIFYSVAKVVFMSEKLPDLENVPVYVWLVSLLWPLVLLPLNEIIKRWEIRVNLRSQKRAVLEFGTKLGMNSPF